jgi:hypothetical protein
VTRGDGAPRSAATDTTAAQRSARAYTARATFTAGSRLTDAERAARERHRDRVRWALRHPTRVTNPNAMRDTLVDALGDKVAIGGWRRGLRVAREPEPFDWDAVRRRADQENVKQIADVLNPRPVATRRRRRVRGPVPASSDRRRAAYVEAVLVAECDRVANAQHGNRNNTLASASFRVGQVACDVVEAFDRLLQAAGKCGLADREAVPTIRSGLRAGCRRPREAA